MPVKYYTKALSTFHQINAFEQDGFLMLDMCCSDDGESINNFLVQNLRQSGEALDEVMFFLKLSFSVYLNTNTTNNYCYYSINYILSVLSLSLSLRCITPSASRCIIIITKTLTILLLLLLSLLVVVLCNLLLLLHKWQSHLSCHSLFFCQMYNTMCRPLPRRFVLPLNITSETPLEQNLNTRPDSTATAVCRTKNQVLSLCWLQQHYVCVMCLFFLHCL